MSINEPASGDAPKGLIKSQQDLAAGIFLIAFGLFCLWASSNLSLGRGSNLGPGSFPRGLSFLLMGVGAIVLVQAFTVVGAKLEAWNIKGIVFVLGAVLLFAATIRGITIGRQVILPPLGLAVAGPLTLIISSLAADERKWGQTLIFAAAMTIFCIVLFRGLLGLPIPVAPWAGY